jgi:hypothetical protein
MQATIRQWIDKRYRSCRAHEWRTGVTENEAVDAGGEVWYWRGVNLPRGPGRFDPSGLEDLLQVDFVLPGVMCEIEVTAIMP